MLLPRHVTPTKLIAAIALGVAATGGTAAAAMQTAAAHAPHPVAQAGAKSAAARTPVPPRQPRRSSVGGCQVTCGTRGVARLCCQHCRTKLSRQASRCLRQQAGRRASTAGAPGKGQGTGPDRD